MKKHVALIVLITIISCIAAIYPAYAEDNDNFDGIKYMEENFDSCSNKRVDSLKILCISVLLNAYDAFLWLYELPIHQEIDKEKAIENLRIKAITIRPAYNEKQIEYIKLMGIDAPEFYEIFHEAMAWGELEKDKSAEELYALSQSVASKITDKKLRYHFNIAYLRLAAKKGHKQAKIEIDAIVETVTKEIREEYKDQYKE